MNFESAAHMNHLMDSFDEQDILNDVTCVVEFFNRGILVQSINLVSGQSQS